MGGRAGRRPKPERERAIYYQYQVEQKGFGALYVGTRLVICEIGLSQDRRQAGPFGALSSASAPDRARIAGDPRARRAAADALPALPDDAERVRAARKDLV